MKVFIKIVGTSLVGSLLTTGFLVRAEVKSEMNQMMGYILDLKPFIVSEKQYSDPAHSATIQPILERMVQLSKDINHDEKIKNSPKQVSSASLHQQFQEASETFNRGNKNYSLWLLRSNLSNCMTCHTQLPAQSTGFGESKQKKTVTNSFQEAEFLYIVRNFDKALELYGKSVEGFPGNKISAENIDTIRARKVYYFVRVKRDLKGLNASLLHDIKNKKLPLAVLQKFRSYSEAALSLDNENSPDLKNDQQVRQYAEQILQDDLKGNIDYSDTRRNLKRLQLSGYLYEYLDKNPKTSLLPEVYYWLSFCESRWDKGSQDSLPEQYLRRCVNEFPKSSVAKKCYREYEDFVQVGYTGSSGTHIPAEVSQELSNMRKKIRLNK